MKKILLFSILLFATSYSLLAQDMTKQQTLDYILKVYRTANRFYITEYRYYDTPQKIDYAKLEFDQLILYYNTAEYTGPRSATINGQLILNEAKNGIMNSDGDWVLQVQPQNTAELKRLYYALKHLQNFIEDDPFANQVSEYEVHKQQQDIEKQRLEKERQERLEAQYAEQRRQDEMQRRRENERQRREEERIRSEEERAGRAAVQQMQQNIMQSIYGGGGG